MSFQLIVHSSFLIEIDGVGILTDPGEIPDEELRRKFGQNFWQEDDMKKVDRLDGMFISHTDDDHRNLLHAVVIPNPNTPIYTSKTAAEVIREQIKEIQKFIGEGIELRNEIHVLNEERVELKGIKIRGIGKNKATHIPIWSTHPRKDNMALFSR